LKTVTTNPEEGQPTAAGQPDRQHHSDMAENKSGSEDEDRSSSKSDVQSEEEQDEDMEESGDAEKMDIDKESDEQSEGEKVCTGKFELIHRLKQFRINKEKKQVWMNQLRRQIFCCI
jgi:hypothetical protein